MAGATTTSSKIPGLSSPSTSTATQAAVDRHASLDAGDQLRWWVSAFFNVYGPREQHQGLMASVAFHLNTQVKQGDNPKLFEGCDGFPDGGQMRDFIYVDDVCRNLWFWQNPQHSGIFNCGTGRAEPFQNVAEAVIRHHQKGAIEYIPFPDHQGSLPELHTGGSHQVARRRL